MGTTVVTVKLTEQEIEVLDWLVSQCGYLSRSDALRTSFIQQASMSGLTIYGASLAFDSRLDHPMRKSKHARPKRAPPKVDEPELNFTRSIQEAEAQKKKGKKKR